MAKKEDHGERDAEELSKELKQVSVSAFFERNRHLLGYDNLSKALLTVVKEACDNSLTYDMPLLIRKNGNISIVKIGELIDSYIGNNKDVVGLRDGNLEKLKLNENTEVISFDKNNLKLDFHRVSTLFRHKVNSKIYRVKLVSGRYVDLTAYHSVFTIKDGKVVSISTSELKEGMPIVVPRRGWEVPMPIQEINLVEEILRLNPSLTKNINVYGINNILTDNFIKDIRSILPKNRWYRTNDFRRFNYIPINLLRELKVDLNELSKSKVGFSFSEYYLPAIIKMDHNFAEILGLYIAEGSMLKTLTRLHFSFSYKETNLVYYLYDLFEKAFGFSPLIKAAHKTAYNVIANSKILCFFFRYILNVGDAANKKKIPNIVFSLSEELRYSFLVAYLTGDGHPTDELFKILKNDLTLKDMQAQKITCATASFELYNGLQYLLASLGLGYSVGENKAIKRMVKKVLANFGKSYQVYIYIDNKNSAINYLPVEDTIVSTTDSKLNYSINRRNQINVNINTLNQTLSTEKLILKEGIATVLNGDLGVLRVSSIEEVNYNHGWVYDVAVPDCENFVAGVGAIVCHNSLDATEEARILPEVDVKIKTISETRFLITVEDNGPGIPKEHLTRVFGSLLYGSKFHRLRQSRGIQGIGISAAVLYSQLTTGKAVKVWSKTSKDKKTHFYEMHIDVHKNQAEVKKEEALDIDKPHGVKIEIEIEARYQKGKQGVDEYLRQTAITNPHLQLNYINPDNEKIIFKRSSNNLPKESEEIKPHPHGTELGVLIRMLKETKSRNLQSFLTTEFCRIGSGTAKEIITKALLNLNDKPQNLMHDRAEKLYKSMQEAKVIAPPTDCLSPIGENDFLKSVQTEIKAEFYTSITRSPTVYRGYPFQIDSALAYGGELNPEESIKVMRFANRVPLLYQHSACAVTEAIKETNWRAYGLQQSGGNLPAGPVVLAVHIASVWVPFTSEAKEAIAHYPEIIKEIKLAVQECGRRLGIYIKKNVRAREQKEKASLFEKYIPELASSLSEITKENKTKLIEALNKRLKKDLPLLIEISEEDKDKKIEGVVVQNKNDKQTTL